MRAVLILACVLALAVPAAWVFAGRHCALLADRFFTAPPETLPATPLRYAPGSITIGEFDGPLLGVDGQPVLLVDGKAFPMGTPDPGDTVSLQKIRGRLAWPSWFEANFMTGGAPDWRRNLYYRLIWRKADGRELTMLWRWEEVHYPSAGWSPGQFDRLGATGLVEVRVTEAGK